MGVVFSGLLSLFPVSDVIHFTNLHTDDCPPDLEEIGRDDDDADYRFPSGATSGLPTLNDTYGEKTIDEDDMEAYFNGMCFGVTLATLKYWFVQMKTFSVVCAIDSCVLVTR